MNALQEKYLTEVGHRLRHAGFEAGPEYNGLLPIQKDAHQLCNINMHGGVSYDPDFVRKKGQEDALDQARQIAVETLTYMRQMASAPLLTVDGLSGDYRVLAEFGNVVLAGHERKGGYGVEFVTWERIREGTGLWQGDYYENDYAAAKRGFAARSGLVDEDHQLTREHSVAVYHCIQEVLENGIASSMEQERLLLEIRDKIQRNIPDLAAQISQMDTHEPKWGMEQI